jgi:GMP reductase
MIKQELHYQDIYLIPRKTIVGSRKECDTSVKLGKHIFDMPVYASNMKSVVDNETCMFFAKHNWFYTMHRFNVDPVEFIKLMHSKSEIASISIGVNEESYQQIKDIKSNGLIPEYITLDIANAWCDKGEKMIKTLKESFPDTFIIAGNVATGEAVIDLENWGADACKVGIAGGSVCTTKFKTAFHRPMVNTVQECVENARKPIISDGGIVHHGDIAKALALGATMVMSGNLFSGWTESAGEILEIEGHLKKAYFGSASETNKGEYKNVEGKKIFVDYKGPMEKLLIELKEDLQSSISYAGGKNLAALMNAQIITCNK